MELICPNCQVKFEYSALNCSAAAYKRYVSIVKNAYSSIPWPIIMNFFEREYLDFILDSPQKAFFVTWPWNRIKIIPLIASEYVMRNPQSRVLIVDRHATDAEIWHYAPTESQNVEEEVKACIVKSKLESQILKKQIASKYTIRYPQRSPRSGIILGNINKAKKTLEEDYLGEDEDWGLTEEINIKGKIKEYSVGNGPRLKMEEIETYFSNLRCDVVSIQRIISSSDMAPIDSEKFIFCNTDEFIELVNNGAPLDFDLILIPDGDHMMASVNNYIDRLLVEKRVFIFSLNRDIRYRYGLINTDNDIVRQNIIPHTIDCLPVLEKYSKRESGNDSLFSSKLSSELTSSQSPPLSIEIVEALGRIQDVFNLISSFPSDDNIIRYLRWVQRTPLNVKDDRNAFKIKILNNEMIPSGEVVFEEFIRRIEDIDPDVSTEVHSIMSEIYGTYDSPKSPLFEVAVERIDRELARGKNAFLIVHWTASKGTKRKLSAIKRGDIKVETWETIQTALNNNKESNNIIVSLSPPFPWNSLELTNVQKIIHLCSSADQREINDIFEKRFNEYLRKPCYRIERDGPPFLLDSLKDEKMPTATICDDIVFDYYSKSSNTRSVGGGISNNIISKGKNAILLQNGINGIFIAPPSSLFVKDNSIINYCKIDPKTDLSWLKGKNILIDKQRMYKRFRVVISEFLINNVKSKINYSLKEWNNYLELLLDSQYWIESLDEAIERYSYITDEVNSEETIIDRLSCSGIVAKDKQTISNWRKNEELDTDMGLVKIYNTEAPKGDKDLDIIFKTLSNYTAIDSERINSCKIAINYIRKIRTGILRKQRLPTQIRSLMGDINDVLEALFIESDTFHTTEVKKVKLSKDVEEMTIISSPIDYCEN